MSSGIDVIRITTVHPALVHFALGTLPLLILAYGIAVLRKSERWTFVGDVSAGVTAALAIVAAAFGLVANWVLAWPFDMGLWRWLHVGFGAASTIALTTFASVRLWQRARSPVLNATMFWWATGIASLMLFAGWIGGEVLVYHSGMAVKAAANGALAPTTRVVGAPHDLMEAMAQIRPAWARATVSLTAAVVHEPTSAEYSAIAESAQQMRTIAEWLQQHGKNNEPEKQSELKAMAEQLASRASDLERAAQARQLPDVARALGEVTNSCSGCHASLRWGRRQAHSH